MTIVEFQPDASVNVVHLSALKDSKSVSVTMYPNEADVSRIFEFEVKAGQNKVTISDLPPMIYVDSVR